MGELDEDAEMRLALQMSMAAEGKILTRCSYHCSLSN